MLHLDLTYSQATFSLQVQAELDDPVTGVLGPSGAGKSTLLQVVAGLAGGGVQGRIVLGSTPLLDTTQGIDVPPEQRRVGYVFQEGLLFPHLNVRGNLLFGHRPGGEGLDLDSVVKTLELEALLGRRPANLSGGERQRAALGRALLASPRLLLLDEPLASVDKGRRRRILSLIARVRDTFQIPMLYVTHEVSEVLSLTNRLLILDEGRTVAHGSLRTLGTQAEVLRVALELGWDNVLPVAVSSHDQGGGVTEATCGTAQLVLPHLPAAAPGENWTIHLRPEEILLAPAQGGAPTVSARNRLLGEVQHVAEVQGRVFVEVALQNEGPTLRVEVTRRALQELALGVGTRSWCLFKTSAVRWGARNTLPGQG